MTEMMPVMRNTALSRPHARSASDVPMATMKVTKVVESGSFMDVPMAISAPASTRFTEPRMRSKAAPRSMMVSSVLKRRLNQARTPAGVIRRMTSRHDMVRRTSRRAMREEPNISSLPLWLPRPTSVCDTLRAFFEVASDTTIITPAPMRNHTLVSDGPLSDPMR